MTNVFNRDDILSNLYSLRAGTSYIAIEAQEYENEIANATDKLNAILDEENESVLLCENKLKNIEEQLFDTDRKQNNEIRALENNRTKLMEKLNEINDKETDPKGHVKRCKQTLNRTVYRERRSFFIWLTIAILFTLCIPILYLIGYLKEIMWLSITGIAGGGTFAMIAWGVFAGSYHSLKESISYRNHERYELERAKDDYCRYRNGVFDKQIKELENEISVINERLTLISQQQQSDKKEKLLTDIDDAKRKLNIAINNRNDNIRRAQQVYQSECAVAYEHIVTGKKVLNALISTYSPILDIRDWQNLDLLIYYIETNRADTIKEALLLTDTERRNNRLISEIKNASASISQSIHNGLSYLQSSIASSLSRISNNISEHNNTLNELSGAIYRQTNTIGAMNSSIDNAVSEAVLRKALITEANKTSSQLLEQVTKLKTLAEAKE